MKCTICNTEIKGRYLVDAWQQPMCAEHQVEHCFSCGRFVRPSDFHTSDGRCLCGFCLPSVVSLPRHIEWVETRVRSILASRGISDIPQRVPIRLVTPAEMAKLNGSALVSFQQPGLTQTSKMVGLLFSRCSHSIYLFDHLPKIQFAGVLAHEMLHAWQNEKGISLPPPATEGFCNVGSYVVYEAIGTELARYFIRCLEGDPNPVYGDGFRKVIEVYRQSGDLVRTMEVLKQ